MTKKELYEINYLAIEEMFNSQIEKRKPSKEIISRYKGYGGCSEILQDHRVEWNKSTEIYKEDVIKLKKLIFNKYKEIDNNSGLDRSLNFFSCLKKNTSTSFYTNDDLIDAIITPLRKSFGKENIKILDPSSGTGNYIKRLETIFTKSEIDAIDIDKVALWFNRNSTSVSKINEEGYQKEDNSEEYDLITSNIPFGDIRVFDSSFDKKDKIKYESQSKIHLYYFTKSIDKLKPNGYINFITSTGVMDSKTNKEYREYLMCNCRLISAQRLPSSTFKDVQTSALSDVIILQKRETPIQISELTEDEIKFTQVDSIDIDGNEHNINSFYKDHKECIHGKLISRSSQYGRNVIDVINKNEFTAELNRNINQDIGKRAKKQYTHAHTELEKKVDDFLIEKSKISKNFTDFKDSIKDFEGEVGVPLSDNSVVDYLAFDRANRHKNSCILASYFYNNASLEKTKTLIETKNISDKAFVLTGDTYQYKDILKNELKGRWNRKESAWMFPISRKEEILNFFKDNYNDKIELTELKEENNSIDYDLSKDGIAVKQNKVYRIENGIEYNIKVPRKDIAKVELLLSINLAQENIQTKENRDKLNELYDQFSKEYGNLNKSNNIRLISKLGYKQLFALEREEAGEWVKADIFFQDLKEKIEDDQSKIQTIDDAIVYSLNTKGKIDIDLMAKALDKDAKQLKDECLTDGVLFENPLIPDNFDSVKANLLDSSLFDNVTLELATRERFLSGPIHDKIKCLENKEIINKENHLKILEDIKPSVLSLKDIDPTFGESWIPLELKQFFVNDLFRSQTDLLIVDDKVIDIKEPSTFTSEYMSYGLQCRGARSISARKIALHAYNNTSPKIYTDLGNGNKVLNEDAMRIAENKIDQINTEFKTFINEKESVVNKLEQIYYLQNLQFVKNEESGEHLQLENLNKFKLYEHQKNAIWHLVQNGGGVVDHVVGAGKTLTMCCSAMEMKRMGIVQKPMIIGLKANIKSIYKDFKEAYPNAKILFPNTKDLTPDGRQIFLDRMMNNDWDCVIMTHEQFGKIPQDEEIIKNHIQHEIRVLEDTIRYESASKGQLKRLERTKESLEARLEATMHNIQKYKDENVINFSDTGVDHLFVDESQQFKNLQSHTLHKDVAGLNTQGSNRAMNLKIASEAIHNKYYNGEDKGITFLSGTVISNSVTELYTIFRYLRPAKLENLKIRNLDDWLKSYATKSSEYEMNTQNQVQKKERFREFKKLPELSKLYNDITHLADKDTVKIEKPEIKTHLVEIEPSGTQQEYSERLLQFAESGNSNYIADSNIMSSEKGLEKAKMLIATNLAKYMSIDMRLINQDQYTEVDGGKSHALCDNIHSIYQKFNNQKGTQIVFSNDGVPNSSRFDLYSDIRMQLERDYGIPQREVAFIHEYKSDNKRQELFNRINKGEIRVVIGSTEKLGTGVNIQNRVVAMHHLDIPWRPSDYEQRNGRGVRQGNKIAKEFNNNKVDNYVYATKNTLDAYKFNLLAIKQNFIDQIKKESISSRNFDDGGDENSISFQEYSASISGRQELLEKTKLEKKLLDLEKKVSTNEKYIKDLRRKLNVSNRDLIGLREIKDKLSQDSVDINKIKDHFSDENCKSGIRFDQKFFENKKEIGIYIKANINKDPILSFGNFQLKSSKIDDYTTIDKEVKNVTKTQLFVTSNNTGIKYTSGQGFLIADDTKLGDYFSNALLSNEKQLLKTENNIKYIARDKDQYSQQLSTSALPKNIHEDIENIKNEISRLNRILDSEDAPSRKVKMSILNN